MFYWPPADLQEAFRRIGLKRDELLVRANPFSLDLGEKKSYKLNLDDLSKKNTNSRGGGFDDEYFLSKDRRMLLLFLKRSSPLMISPPGLVLTFGLTGIVIGELNIMTALTTALLLFPTPGFDSDVRNMLETRLPSIRLSKEIDLRYNTGGGDPLIVISDSLEEARALYESLRAPRPERDALIARIESILP